MSIIAVDFEESWRGRISRRP